MIKDMTGALVRVTCVLLGLSCLGAVTRTQSFSADLVTTHVGRKPTARLGHVYVSNGKVRIEAPEFVDGFFIVEGDPSAAWFVRPRQRLFMDAKQSSPLTQLLVPVDPDDPCRQWQVMEALAGPADRGREWRCALIGREVRDGRETLKYRAISPQGHRSDRWIDPQRAFAVRLETDEGTTVALENIVDAPQPSSLFAIPSDYHKFDPQQLIDLVKRSDVWVETPR